MYKLTPSQGAENKISTPFNNALAILVSVVLLSGCAPAETESSEPVKKRESSVAEASVELNDERDKASYGLGYSLARNLENEQGNIVNYEAFLAGVRDQVKGTDLQVTETELSTAFATLTRLSQQETVDQGMAFLTENGQREGVVTLESGLQYEIMVEGEGATPSASDTVKTHYHGTLIDGTVFDSSVQRNQPAEFGVTQVIKGWVEALQLMPVGSKWKLFIPADLAYGDRSPSPAIPGGSTLIFEVELLEIVSS